MESVERKRKSKKGVKGDGDDEMADDRCIGGKEVSGEDGVLSSEMGLGSVGNVGGEKKRKKKEKGKKEGIDDGGRVLENLEGSEGVGVEGKSEKKKKEKGSGKKRKDKKGDDGDDLDIGGKKGDVDGGVLSSETDLEVVDNIEGEKKRKKKKEKRRKEERDESVVSGDVGGNDGGDENVGEVENGGSKKKKKKKEKRSGKERKREKDLGKGMVLDSDCVDGDLEKEPRKKKRKREKERVVDDSTGVVVTGENQQSENTKAKKGKKRVSFSGQVEVFPLPSDSSIQENKLVQAKRFTPEEDKIIQEAVHNYIEDRGLGEEGLNMVLNCKSNPAVKGCWKVIGEAIPYRPYLSVYNRAHILFERGERRSWSEEEIELLRKYIAENGTKWKVIAEELRRHRRDVKDAWRRLRVLDKSKGRWSQTEYQTLFDLVNTDLRLKIIEDEEKKRKHGMLRDNIHWTAVSEALKTRTGPNCSQKWYSQLQSPMVAQGIWADIDDNCLIDELYNLDATCIEDVDWDNLLEHRSGEVCRNRWNQMALHIGKNKSFAEQVEMLTKRYCPDLIEVREAWGNKPYVD